MPRKHSRKQHATRAVVQRMAFMEKRSVDCQAELAWATFTQPIPKGMVTPPEWVKCAILEVGKAKATLRPLLSRNPKEPLPATMTAQTIIAEIETLPAAERAKVIAYVGRAMEADDSWIPDSFKQGMRR